jgi:5-methylcytosine-specific restriction endonuclease McrA
MGKKTTELLKQWQLLRLAVDLTEAQIEDIYRERARRIRREFRRNYDQLRQTLLDTQPHVCAHCGTSSRLTVDHIQPVSMGGRNAPSNLQFLCETCATRKANSLAEHWSWLRRRAGYNKPDGIPASVQIVLDTASQHAGNI